jgi:hypothetical protein
VFRNLKDILEKNFLGLREQRDFQEKWIFLNWSKSVGAEIDRRTSPYRVAGNTLFVHAVNSVWSSQLASMKEQIKKSLNKAIAPLKIDDIRFSVRFPLVRKFDFSLPEEREEEPSRIEPLTEEERMDIANLTGTIDDEELRTRMRSIMTREKEWSKMQMARGWKACPGCGVLTERGEFCPFCRIERK